LQVAIGFVGNYALGGLSPQIYDMPVIQHDGEWTKTTPHRAISKYDVV
jgi:hypothetical protein